MPPRLYGTYLAEGAMEDAAMQVSEESGQGVGRTNLGWQKWTQFFFFFFFFLSAFSAVWRPCKQENKPLWWRDSFFSLDHVGCKRAAKLQHEISSTIGTWPHWFWDKCNHQHLKSATCIKFWSKLGEGNKSNAVRVVICQWGSGQGSTTICYNFRADSTMYVKRQGG